MINKADDAAIKAWAKSVGFRKIDTNGLYRELEGGGYIYLSPDQAAFFYQASHSAQEKAIRHTLTSLQDISHSPSGDEYLFKDGSWSSNLSRVTDVLLAQLHPTPKEEQ